MTIIWNQLLLEVNRNRFEHNLGEIIKEQVAEKKWSRARRHRLFFRRVQRTFVMPIQGTNV